MKGTLDWIVCGASPCTFIKEKLLISFGLEFASDSVQLAVLPILFEERTGSLGIDFEDVSQVGNIVSSVEAESAVLAFV